MKARSTAIAAHAIQKNTPLICHPQAPTLITDPSLPPPFRHIKRQTWEINRSPFAHTIPQCTRLDAVSPRKIGIGFQDTPCVSPAPLLTFLFLLLLFDLHDPLRIFFNNATRVQCDIFSYVLKATCNVSIYAFRCQVEHCMFSVEWILDTR